MQLCLFEISIKSFTSLSAHRPGRVVLHCIALQQQQRLCVSLQRRHFISLSSRDKYTQAQFARGVFVRTRICAVFSTAELLSKRGLE